MRTRLKVVGAAAVAVLAFCGYALAESGEESGASPCAEHHPCVIVNQLAADGAPAKLAMGEEMLAAQAQPVSDCPEAAAVYDQAKVEVDAVAGRCPSAEEAKDQVESLTSPFHKENYELALRDLVKPR